MVLAVNDIVRAESLEALFRRAGLCVLGDSTLDELPHAVSYEASHLLEAALGKAATAKRMVRAQEEVFEGVGQRPVEVKYDCLVLHLFLFGGQRYEKD